MKENNTAGWAGIKAMLTMLALAGGNYRQNSGNTNVFTVNHAIITSREAANEHAWRIMA